MITWCGGKNSRKALARAPHLSASMSWITDGFVTCTKSTLRRAQIACKDDIDSVVAINAAISDATVVWAPIIPVQADVLRSTPDELLPHQIH